MRRILTAVLAVGTMALLSVSTAAALTFDAFGDSQGTSLAPATAASSGGDTGPSAWLAVTAGSTDIANLERSLDVTYLAGGDAVKAYVNNGHYNYASDPSTTGTGVIDWRISGGGTADLSTWSGLGISILVTFQDLITGAPSIDFSLTDSDGTTISKTFALGATAPPSQLYFAGFGSFGITAAGGDNTFDWDSFSSARLFLNGANTPGLDISIDIVATPEPATLVLLGFGLAACSAAAYRRRKKA